MLWFSFSCLIYTVVLGCQSVPFHCHILQFRSYRCLVDKCSTQAVNVVVDVVYSPYVPYLLDYPTLQQTFLTEQLQATRLVGITQIIYNITWQLIIRSHRGSVHLHSAICNSVTWDFLGRLWLVVVTLIILTVTMVRWWCDGDEDDDDDDDVDDGDLFRNQWILHLFLNLSYQYFIS